MEMKKYMEMAKDTLANVGEKIDESLVYAGNKTGISPMAIKSALPKMVLIAGAVIIPEVTYDKLSDSFAYTGNWVGVPDWFPDQIGAGSWMEQHNYDCGHGCSRTIASIYDNVAAYVIGYGPAAIGRSRISPY